MMESLTDDQLWLIVAVIASILIAANLVCIFKGWVNNDGGYWW